MKLYRLKTQFLGKDLDAKADLGFVVTDSEEKVAEYINQRYYDGNWWDPYMEEDEEGIEETRQDYLTHKGDFHTEYAGEFYDQKYGWEEVSEVTDDQVAMLYSLGMLEKIDDFS